ncbi:hypothetical protein [Nesterenkonia lutea]|uniref:Uncharacterized protein n=1 Tax=Nesterenkonia lutea TaxID=272919 RepID=A0ABR9JF12_9MICC|nr:hypothetical protein [Nesterenkonia lutea]MBE1524509.1 hypothetical protein [Nesterenkonia lutea]
MRWDALFADLESQLDAARTADFDAAVDEASRLEASRLGLAERLRAHRGLQLTLLLPGDQRLNVEIGTVGSDWLSGSRHPHSVLLPLAALRAVEGMKRSAAQAEPSPARRRLGITAPLRRLARDRSMVSVQGPEGRLAQGLISAVGRDFLEIAQLDAGETHLRRAGSPARRTIPLHAVSWLQSEFAQEE